MSKVYKIKTEEDISRVDFGYDKTQNGLSICAIENGVRKPIQFCVGSVQEKLGMIVRETPDEVTTTGRAWEKEKLVLSIERDSDRELLAQINNIARSIYESAFGSIEGKWFGPEESIFKVKVHPIQTLFALSPESEPEWRYLGSGEICSKPQTTTQSKVQSIKRKRGETVKNNATIVKGTDLIGKIDCTKEKMHYKLYKDDKVWAAWFELGDLWSIDDNCGITLKAKYLIVDRSDEAPQKEQQEEEEELPSLDMF